MVIDANVILRYMLRDNPKMFADTKGLFESGQSFTVTDVTIMEVSYVLMGGYGKNRQQIAEALRIFLNLDFIGYKSKLAEKYLELYSTKNLDLADCYLISLSLKTKNKLVTFDKKMQKVYENLTNK